MIAEFAEFSVTDCWYRDRSLSSVTVSSGSRSKSKVERCRSKLWLSLNLKLFGASPGGVDPCTLLADAEAQAQLRVSCCERANGLRYGDNGKPRLRTTDFSCLRPSVELNINTIVMPTIVTKMATPIVSLPEVERLSSRIVRILGGNPGKVRSISHSFATPIVKHQRSIIATRYSTFAEDCSKDATAWKFPHIAWY